MLNIIESKPLFYKQETEAQGEYVICSRSHKYCVVTKPKRESSRSSGIESSTFSTRAHYLFGLNIYCDRFKGISSNY